MDDSAPIVSTGYHGDPILTGLIPVIGRRRALVGWNHQDDSVEGLMKGQIFGWTSVWNRERGKNPKFQVYDTSGNRSLRPGVHVRCGPANFTMVRMFVQYWCDEAGRVPKDMNGEDKKRCRKKYWDLLRKNGYRHECDDDEEGEDGGDGDRGSDDGNEQNGAIVIEDDDGRERTEPPDGPPNPRDQGSHGIEGNDFDSYLSSDTDGDDDDDFHPGPGSHRANIGIPTRPTRAEIGSAAERLIVDRARLDEWASSSPEADMADQDEAPQPLVPSPTIILDDDNSDPDVKIEDDIISISSHEEVVMENVDQDMFGEAIYQAGADDDSLFVHQTPIDEAREVNQEIVLLDDGDNNNGIIDNDSHSTESSGIQAEYGNDGPDMEDTNRKSGSDNDINDNNQPTWFTGGSSVEDSIEIKDEEQYESGLEDVLKHVREALNNPNITASDLDSTSTRSESSTAIPWSDVGGGENDPIELD